ncbi:Uncharacterised protein [Segatella copri]|nr:Uncharacterised protein [Segatella copri]
MSDADNLFLSKIAILVPFPSPLLDFSMKASGSSSKQISVALSHTAYKLVSILSKPQSLT